MKNFKPLQLDSSFETPVYQRTFSGRLTPKRYSVIVKYCASHSYRERCGCEHDCCGHKYEQTLDFFTSSLKKDGTRDIFIRLAEFFNV